MLAEKKLTAAEKKKKEEIVLALKRDNPNMPKDQMYAIATAQAKKVAESRMLEKKRLLLTDEDIEEGSPSFNYMVAKATVEEPEKNFVKIGGKNIRKTMDMKTARKIVKDFENQKNEAQQDFNFKARITPRGDTFEIGGDVFVKEMVEPPKHRYVHIVEKHLNLTEQFFLDADENEVSSKNFNYDHVTSLNWKTRKVTAKQGYALLSDMRNSTFVSTERGYGLLGKDFTLLGPNGLDFPVVVTTKMARKIEQLSGEGNWAPVFSIPPKGDRRGDFNSGDAIIFKWQGRDKIGESTRFTIQLIENGFDKIKWADRFRGTSGFFILAKLGSGFGARISLTATERTLSQGVEYSPTWNLHKQYFNGGYQLFSKRDVYRSRGTGDDYNFRGGDTVPLKVNSLGVFSNKALSPDFEDFDIYKGMTFSAGPGSAGSGESITVRQIIELSDNIENDPRQYNIVNGASQRPGGSGGPLTIYDLIQKQENSRLKDRRSKPKREKDTGIDLGLGDEDFLEPSTPLTREPERESYPTYDPTPSTSTEPEEEQRPAVKPEEAGLITTVVAAFLKTQWENISRIFKNEVNTASQDAMERAITLVKDAINPNSPLGKKIYTSQNITVAALIGAGVGGYFLLRRYLRDRKQRELAKYMYGDFGARRELQTIARRSGLDKVPQQDLMRMLPALERYELSQPSVRRLYDL